MTEPIDPVDYVEQALDEAEDDPDRLWEIHRELHDRGRNGTRQTMTLLIEEEDHDERLRIADLHLMHLEQLLTAHQLLVRHLRAVEVMRQINPRPLKDW